MSFIDWFIVIFFLIILFGSGWYCRRYMRSVSDFLVAGRGVGRWLGFTAMQANMIGLIALIAVMQATYISGLAYFWQRIQTLWVGLFIAVTGFGYYRLRQTNVMTINEFVELRYSKRLRIFAGILCFVGGILNMAIFPIVEARFFVYFLGFPASIEFLGMTVPTTFIISGFLVFVALFFCFIGGQTSIIVTDFIQGMLIIVIFLILGIVAYRTVNWNDIEAAIRMQSKPDQALNPFNKSSDNAFGLSFMLMLAFMTMYNFLSSAPDTARFQSTKDPDESRWMLIINQLRVGLTVPIYFVAVAAFAVMTLPKFSNLAAPIQEAVLEIPNEKVRSQLIVPMFLKQIMPIGITGAFIASLLACSISTFNTYFLGWSGTFVQDIVGQIKRKELSNKAHIRLLKYSSVGVALTVWILSMLYRETDYLIMFMQITMAIYFSGAGAILIGGLYWKRGTVAGAWAAMITGASGAVIGLFVRQLWPFLPYLSSVYKACPLNGMEIAFYNSLVAITVYVIVSLFTPENTVDFDKLFNRNNETVRKIKNGKTENERIQA